ncbi:TetR/AcrR family transcriptional regulator [Rhodococcus aetherivorans]
MVSSPDRRTLIAETTLDLIARDGLRALTHRAVDRALALPDGSCSYYFRTRGALLDAAVHRLAERSRDAFEHSGLTRPTTPVDVDAAARAVATALDRDLAHRRRDLLVRYALATDPAIGAEQRAGLAAALFSRAAARDLMAACGADDADSAAADLVSLAEGLTVDRLLGARSLEGLAAGTAASVAQLARPIAVYLRGLAGGDGTGRARTMRS